MAGCKTTLAVTLSGLNQRNINKHYTVLHRVCDHIQVAQSDLGTLSSTSRPECVFNTEELIRWK